MPKPLSDRYVIPTRDRRVILEFREDQYPTVMLGLVGADVRTPAEMITLEHPTLGIIHASLIRATPRLIWYRQVMRDAATNEQGGKVQFNPSQE